MVNAPEGLVAVATRISTIRTMFTAPVDTSTSLMGDVSFTPPELDDFEPFGDVYQAALASVETAEQAGQAGATMASFGSQPRMLQSFTSQLMGSLGGSTGVGGIAGIGAVGPVVTGLPAIGSVDLPTPTGASVGQIGGYGKLEPPPELAAIGNGRIPSHALQEIGQGSHRLYAPAAQSWRAAVDAAAADGIELRITDSYRSYDQQVDLVRRKGLYSQGGLGAVPGTSNHGWGLAVDADVTDPATLDWMRTNAWRFGFVEAVPREPWHWEFRPAQA